MLLQSPMAAILFQYNFEVWSSRKDDDVIQHWANNGISKDGSHDDGRFVRIIYNSEVLRTPCSDANSDDHLCSMKAFKQMMSKFVVHTDYKIYVMER